MSISSPTRDHAAILKYLGQIRKAEVRPGELNTEVQTCNGPADALAKFLQAANADGAQGWLCTSIKGASPIAIFGMGQTPTVDTASIPLSGELCLGDSSLHLATNGSGNWLLTRITKALVDTNAPTSFILQGSLAADRSAFEQITDVQQLTYEVCWQLREQPTGPASLTPVIFRFTGFHN